MDEATRHAIRVKMEHRLPQLIAVAAEVLVSLTRDDAQAAIYKFDEAQANDIIDAAVEFMARAPRRASAAYSDAHTETAE